METVEEKILLDEHRDLADYFIARTNPLEVDPEIIRESFREYIAPERVALYNAYQTAAKSIEALFDELADAGLRTGLHAPAALCLHLFDYAKKEERGNCRVTPKEFNYNSGLKLTPKST